MPIDRDCTGEAEALLLRFAVLDLMHAGCEVCAKRTCNFCGIPDLLASVSEEVDQIAGLEPAAGSRPRHHKPS